jgi:hypothetical protein
MTKLITTIAITVAVGTIATLVYCRLKSKKVTMKEILDWIKENKQNAERCSLFLCSKLPDETRNELKKQLRFRQVLFGYKLNGSVFACFIDSDGNMLKNRMFWGNCLSEDLQEALLDKNELRIKI